LLPAAGLPVCLSICLSVCPSVFIPYLAVCTSRAIFLPPSGCLSVNSLSAMEGSHPSSLASLVCGLSIGQPVSLFLLPECTLCPYTHTLALRAWSGVGVLIILYLIRVSLPVCLPADLRQPGQPACICVYLCIYLFLYATRSIAEEGKHTYIHASDGWATYRCLSVIASLSQGSQHTGMAMLLAGAVSPRLAWIDEKIEACIQLCTSV